MSHQLSHDPVPRISVHLVNHDLRQRLELILEVLQLDQLGPVLKFAVDARAQRGGLVSELVAFLGCQSISFVLKPRFHGIYFL